MNHSVRWTRLLVAIGAACFIAAPIQRAMAHETFGVASYGMKPFTDTMKQMRQRDEQRLRDIAAGLIWNHSFLNSLTGVDPSTEVRVVDFHEVYTIPRVYLEKLLQRRNLPRLRLLSPYREHLSQGFARFFMRVGLPVAVEKSW